MTKYNLEYKGVKCTSVEWNEKCNLFYFEYLDKEYAFPQLMYVNASADTDHIRIIIEEQFLPIFVDDDCDEIEEAKKQVASDIFKEVADLINRCTYIITAKMQLKELAKKYGVEIENDKQRILKHA